MLTIYDVDDELIRVSYARNVSNFIVQSLFITFGEFICIH